MSLSYQPLRPTAVLDPRLQLENERYYAVLEGGQTVTGKQWTTQSISNSSLQWSAPPPSGSIAMDRKIQLYVPVRLTFTGIATAAGQTLLNSGFDAPRSWPLAGSIETIAATINNQPVSINLADVIHPMADWFNSEEALRAQDWSTTPVFPDQSQSYASLAGTTLNPLGDIGNAITNHEQPRGAFSSFVVVDNPISAAPGQSLTAVVDLAMCEYLILTPFAWSKGCSSSGLINVTSLDINVAMIGQNAANRMWSHCPPSAGPFPPANNQVAITGSNFAFGGTLNGPTSFGATTGNVPLLFATYITPKDTMTISPNIPISYPYSEVVRFFTSQAQIPAFGAAGSSNVVIQSNNIQISSWPSRMYIFARQQNQDLYSSPSNTDTYLQINAASLTVANKNGLLASMNAFQLYQMAVKNGYQGSWNQWNGVTAAPAGFGGALGPVSPAKQNVIGLSGGIMCVEFATDIGMDSLQAPGKLEQTQLSVALTVSNLNPSAITPVLVIIIVNEGTYTVQRLGASTTNIGVLTSQNILDAKQMPGISLKDVESNTGGDFFSGLKSIGDFLKKHKVLSRWVAPALGVASMIPSPLSGPLKAASAIGGPLAAYMGYGDGAGGRYRRKAGGRMRRGRIGYGGGDGGEGEGEGEGEGYGGEEITNEELSRHIEY